MKEQHGSEFRTEGGRISESPHIPAMSSKAHPLGRKLPRTQDGRATYQNLWVW